MHNVRALNRASRRLLQLLILLVAFVVPATASADTGQFGTTVPGLSFGCPAADFKYGNKYALVDNGSVTKITAYMVGFGGGGSQAFRTMIYAADGAGGEPGTLLASSQEVTVAGSAPSGPVDFPVTPSVHLTAGDYWIVQLSGPAGGEACLSKVGGGASSFNVDAYADGPSNPFDTSGPVQSDASQWALYATYDIDVALPTNTVPPAISGTAAVAATLTANDGTWTGAPVLTRSWQLCTPACTDISGETGTSYLIRPGDAGHTVRLHVTATNAAGPTTANSTPTTSIVAPPTNTVPPVSGGGGGGGPDLVVTVGADQTTGLQVGDVVFVTFSIVATAQKGGATTLHLLVTLPDNVELQGAPLFERGSGCTGARNLDCYLDFLSAGMTTPIRMALKLMAGTQAVISARTQQAESDLNPADNQAAITLAIGSAATATPSSAVAAQPPMSFNASFMPRTNKGSTLRVRVLLSRQAQLSAVLTGPNGGRLKSWTKKLSAGQTTLALTLPKLTRRLPARMKLTLAARNGGQTVTRSFMVTAP